MQYSNRQVDIDAFNSYTAELRVLHDYSLGKTNNTLVAGVKYMNNDFLTKLSKGTIGSNYDLTVFDPVWGRDVHLKKKILLYSRRINFNWLPSFL